MNNKTPTLSTLKEFLEFQGREFRVNIEGDQYENEDDLFLALNEGSYTSCIGNMFDCDEEDIEEEDGFAVCGATYEGHEYGRTTYNVLIKRRDGTFWTFKRTDSDHETFKEYIEDHEYGNFIVERTNVKTIEVLELTD